MPDKLIRNFVISIVALGIASVLVISLAQKRRETDIPRAMGVGRLRIMAVFLLQGGVVGSLFGSVLAFGLLEVFSRIFKSRDGSPPFFTQLGPMLVLIASVAPCGIGLTAAVIPTYGAARMDPVQPIRA